MSQSVVGNVMYALRVLARNPGFVATVVVTLALVTGANSAMFSAIDAILLKPLPFPDGDRLVRLSEVREGIGETSIAPIRLQDWNRMSTKFEAISGYFTDSVVDTTGELPERLRRAVVAPHFLDVWGVSPALGRGFSDSEHLSGGPPVIVISDRLFRNRGSDPEIMNRTVRSGGLSFSVIGIMGSARFPDHDVDLWGPFPIDAPFTQSRQPAWLTGIGRLKAGVTIQEARADLERVQAQLAELYPDTDRTIGVHVEPLKDTIVGNTRQSLWFLFGAVSVLLLIACTNIAALLLSRAAEREHDVAIRFSLGASRGVIVRQMLIETGVLAFAGTLLGLFVAAGAAMFFRILAPDLPRVDEITFDARMILYTIASAALVTLLCGVFPAIRSARGGSEALLQSSRGQVSLRHSLQWLLVGVQVAFSVTLLAGAGLLVRSVEALSRVDLGFDTTNVLTFSITGRFGEAGGYDALVQRVNGTLDELAALPGVEATATASLLPGVPGEQQSAFELVEGRAASEPRLIAEHRVVSPSYFETMRIAVVAGELCQRPTDAQQERQVMVNRSFADRYFSGRSVLGLHLAGDSAGRIVGVVGDARELGAHRDPRPTVYGCFSAPSATPWFLVRTKVDALAAARAIRLRIKDLEPQRPVYDVGPLQARIGSAYAQNRLRTLLLVFFAVTALSLACLGIYGTLGYIVSVRSREVGLRMALGAPWSKILWQFLLRALRVVAVACAAGLALSSVFTRLLTSMLYGVSASDPITLSSVVAIVVAVALLAALFPSLRAARIDPMEALRDK